MWRHTVGDIRWKTIHTWCKWRLIRLLASTCFRTKSHKRKIKWVNPILSITDKNTGILARICFPGSDKDREKNNTRCRTEHAIIDRGWSCGAALSKHFILHHKCLCTSTEPLLMCSPSSPTSNKWNFVSLAPFLLKLAFLCLLFIQQLAALLAAQVSCRIKK